MNPRKKEQQDLLFLLCKKGVNQDLINKYYEYKQAVNPYIIGALLQTEQVTKVVRKILRKLKEGIKIDTEEITEIIKNEVIKREILESDIGIKVNQQITRFIKK